MTYALILIKGDPPKRDYTKKLLMELSTNQEFEKTTGVRIEKVLISFGWPDFVLLVKSNNVELVKHSIVELRARAQKVGDTLETSTIICVTQEEMDKKREEWAKQVLT